MWTKKGIKTKIVGMEMPKSIETRKHLCSKIGDDAIGGGSIGAVGTFAPKPLKAWGHWGHILWVCFYCYPLLCCIDSSLLLDFWHFLIYKYN